LKLREQAKLPPLAPPAPPALSPPEKSLAAAAAAAATSRFDLFFDPTPNAGDDSPLQSVHHDFGDLPLASLDGSKNSCSSDKAAGDLGMMTQKFDLPEESPPPLLPFHWMFHFLPPWRLLLSLCHFLMLPISTTGMNSKGLAAVTLTEVMRRIKNVFTSLGLLRIAAGATMRSLGLIVAVLNIVVRVLGPTMIALPVLLLLPTMKTVQSSGSTSALLLVKEGLAAVSLMEIIPCKNALTINSRRIALGVSLLEIITTTNRIVQPRWRLVVESP